MRALFEDRRLNEAMSPQLRLPKMPWDVERHNTHKTSCTPYIPKNIYVALNDTEIKSAHNKQ